MTALVAEVSEETLQTRSMAIKSLADFAFCFGLPLPDRLVVWLTEPDAAAEVTIRAYAERLDGRVLYRLIDDDRRVGLEINAGGAVLRILKIRDSYVQGGRP